MGSTPVSGRSPGEGNATHSRILAWKISQTKEPGRLPSMEVTEVSDMTYQLNNDKTLREVEEVFLYVELWLLPLLGTCSHLLIHKGSEPCPGKAHWNVPAAMHTHVRAWWNRPSCQENLRAPRRKSTCERKSLEQQTELGQRTRGFFGIFEEGNHQVKWMVMSANPSATSVVPVSMPP